MPCCDFRHPSQRFTDPFEQYIEEPNLKILKEWKVDRECEENERKKESITIVRDTFKINEIIAAKIENRPAEPITKRFELRNDLSLPFRPLLPFENGVVPCPARWCQNDEIIYLRFWCHYPVDVRFEIKPTKIIFMCRSHPKEFSLQFKNNLYLHKPIRQHDFRVTFSWNSIQLNLRKIEKCHWPRLLEGDHLSFDSQHWLEEL